MDQKFFIARSLGSQAIMLCEVCDGLLYYLNGDTRTGIQRIRGNPIDTVRGNAKVTFGDSVEISVEEIGHRVGKYYPSIARPLFHDPNNLKNIKLDSETGTIRQVEREIGILVDQLEECFDVVSPEPANFDAFGFKFQNIIHLSCIGVEDLFVKIFRDNRIANEHFTFQHFRKLNDVMKLSDYSLRLPKYPWIGALVPFSGWSSGPLARLSWQVANNALKHSRSDHAKAANLRNSMESVCALVVVFVAIFGSDVLDNAFQDRLSYFDLERRPSWAPHERYIFATNVAWCPEYLEL